MAFCKEREQTDLLEEEITMGLKIMNEEALKHTLKMKDVIETVENVYSQKSENQSVVWDTIFYDFEPGKADMDIKSGYLKKQKIFGHKTVTWFGDNLQKNLPTLNGMICIFDGNTGMPLGITEGAYITGMRTGAAAAIGAKYLANKAPKNVLIVGAGNQLKFQITAILSVFPDLEKVQVFDKDFMKASNAIKEVSSDLVLMGISQTNTQIVPVKDLQIATECSEIIITITPSRVPFLKKDWIKPGTHLSTMGADMEGKQEIDENIFSNATIFTDDLHHSSQVGEMEIALKNKIIQLEDISGEIGDLILNKTIGRKTAEDITIFDATGMALMDIATAKAALDMSEDKNIVNVEF